MILFSGDLHKLKKKTNYQFVSAYIVVASSTFRTLCCSTILLIDFSITITSDWYYETWSLLIYCCYLFQIWCLLLNFKYHLILLPIFRNTTTEWDILSEIIMSHLHNQLKKTRGRTSWLNLCNLLTELIILRRYLLLMS